MLQGGRLEEASVGELIGRAADDAKRLVRAEVKVQIETVKVRLAGAKLAAIYFAAALLLAIAAVIVLVIALGDLLAIWVGVAGGHALAAVIVLVIAGLLGWLGAKRLSPPPASPESAR